MGHKLGQDLKQFLRSMVEHVVACLLNPDLATNKPVHQVNFPLISSRSKHRQEGNFKVQGLGIKFLIQWLLLESLQVQFYETKLSFSERCMAI